MRRQRAKPPIFRHFKLSEEEARRDLDWFFGSIRYHLYITETSMPQKPWCYIDVHPDLKVKIDREDLERVGQHSWRVTKGTTGRQRVVTSIRGPKGVRTITLGKFLMNPAKGLQVYPRRFNDGLDYRKGNLVVCTLQERQRLLPKKRVQTSSEYRGVSYSQSHGKWRAGIEVGGRSLNLGLFKTEDDAAEAYNSAALKHFGDHAYQNRIGNKKVDKRK
jgi:AP2-like factor (euAP2 lineage)